MFLNHRKLILLFMQFLFFINLYADKNEIANIKENFIKSVLCEEESDTDLHNLLMLLPKERFYSDQMVVELMDRYPIDNARIHFLLQGIQADGTWLDIDYSNQNRSGWQPKIHVERILELTKLYSSKNSTYYKSPAIKSAIHLSLNYWFDKRPKSLNWWHNQIGVPKILGAAFILFEQELSEEELKSAIEIMDSAKVGMTGQNRVWLAGNVLMKGLLLSDFNLVQQARDIIVSEIRISEKEGIKIDGSFHQHGAQQQFGNYGAAYISGMSFWSKVFVNSSLAFEQTKLDILNSLIHNGYSWILWKGNMDVNALGRQLFHNVQQHKAFVVGFSANGLLNVDTKNIESYKHLLADNFNKVDLAVSDKGFKYFWMSDMSVFRNSSWMSSIKMSSKRVVGGESGNGDNLRGYYMADGASYIYVDGDEYRNIFPCWDWRKLPGVSSYETEAPLKQLSWGNYHNQSDFVGAVSSDRIGLTAMDFNREGLKARKCWIVNDEFMLCLGAGISSDADSVVTTSIEQRIARTNAPLLHKFPETNANKGKVDKYFHDKTAYITIGEQNVKAKLEKKLGKWSDIMSIYPNDLTEEKELFSLWIDHGVKPRNASYQYLILPATTEEAFASFDIDKVKIIENSPNLQAVELMAGKQFCLVAYEPSEIALTNSLKFKSYHSGLFIIKQKGDLFEITVSDPTQVLTFLKIEINGRVRDILLPTGEFKGSSVTIEI